MTLAVADTTTITTDALRGALATTSRPSPTSALSASLSFGWRAMLKIKHVPLQLLDVTMFPIMFTLLYSPREYLQELLPGIVVMNITWITISATVMIVLGIALGFRPDGGLVGVVAAIGLLLIFAFCLSWGWTALAFYVPTPDSVMQTAMTVLFPLTFASNVFVDPSTMPGWVQAFVEVNPISHLATAARGLMHGDVDAGAIGWSLGWSAVLLAVFAPLTMRRYNQA